MISVDTNILVRLLTGDDFRQAKKVADLLNDNKFYICKTVFLETELVLRSCYNFDRSEIAGVFNKLVDFPNSCVEDEVVIIKTIAWYRSGFDFADALHLASSSNSKKFATFDKKLIKKMNGINTSIFAISP